MSKSEKNFLSLESVAGMPFSAPRAGYYTLQREPRLSGMKAANRIAGRLATIPRACTACSCNHKCLCTRYECSRILLLPCGSI